MAGLKVLARCGMSASLLAAPLAALALLAGALSPAHASEADAAVEAAAMFGGESGPVPVPAAKSEADGERWQGEASWYGPGLHGRPTASGERFDRHAMTAAHRSLPFGTIVRVESLRNGRSVDVRINDRGPYAHRRRIIDLSEAAARLLGLGRKAGVAPVRITIVPKPRD